MRTCITGKLAVLALLALLTSTAIAGDDVRFRSAKPIWPKDREKEMNLLVGFRAVIDAPVGEKAVLRVAAASIYRVWLNGEFLGCGPARGPHGYYRVDEWELGDKLKPGKTLVAIEVAGYNCNSYYLLDQPSFLQAEVTAVDRVLASTAGDGEKFSARLLDQRVQKVARYSFQRPFTEVYRLAPDSDSWRRDIAAPEGTAETAVLSEKNLLPRRVLYSESTKHPPVKIVAVGHVEPIETPKEPWKDRALTGIGPTLKGFPESELATIPSIEAQGLRSVQDASPEQPYVSTTAMSLAAGEYRNLDLGLNRTGFVGAKVTCLKKTRLWFLFDEVLTGGDVDWKRLGCTNIISYEFSSAIRPWNPARAPCQHPTAPCICTGGKMATRSSTN